MKLKTTLGMAARVLAVAAIVHLAHPWAALAQQCFSASWNQNNCSGQAYCVCIGSPVGGDSCDSNPGASCYDNSGTQCAVWNDGTCFYLPN